MHMKRLLSLAIVTLLAIPFIANAQVSIQPLQNDRLIFSLAAGETISHDFNLVNINNEPIDVAIYAADGALTSAGGFTVQPRNSKQLFVGSWIKTDQEIYHLGPKEKKTITFKITIPGDVTPGDYGGGLTAEPVLVDTALQGSGGKVSTRVAIPVYITVAGQKITKYSWDNFSHDFSNRHTFSFTLKNEGNTQLRASGEITLEDTFGNKYNVPMGDISLSQNSSNSNKIQWNETPYFGFFKATANITFYELDAKAHDFKEIGHLSKTVSFNVIPWPTIIVILVALLALVGGLSAKKISFNKLVRSCKSIEVKDGDTFASIAKEHDVSWELLAKINKLEAPYTINKGQKILVPPKK